MEIAKTSNRIHPLMAAAAVSVTLVSLVGAAAITGVLPNSHSTTAPVGATASGIAGTSSATDTTLAANSDANSSLSSKKENTESSPTPSSHAAPIRHPQPHTSYKAATASVCTSCGRVESVHTIQQQAKPSGLGIAAGAVLGGVLGNQVGGGNGRTLATVAGAVGGGYAGNEIEKRSRATSSYQVRVRMDNGSIRTFTYAEQPGWGAGDRVRVINGSLTARG